MQFGLSLDKDDFNRVKNMLSLDCKYVIGNEVLIGPEDICKSYEQNMKEGRKKLDSLEWGRSNIEQINEVEFYVHFTDYLTHKGIYYIHRCKQKLKLDNDNKIASIEHIHDQEEQDNLNIFYKKVGLK